ncbi:MAG: hypothetical protein KKB20_30480 [Proteobacteria bacterium]|nr:hypothetical protein [Pseudomonadota bacterium]
MNSNKNDIHALKNSITAGIDIGFVFSKAAIVKGSDLLYSCYISSGNNYKKSAKHVLEQAIEGAGVAFDEIDSIVSTGCGSTLVPYDHIRISDINCQARGINRLFENAHTLIEIGGQAAKVINIDTQGRVIGFNISEKCATGSGSILNILMKIFGIQFEQLCILSAQSQKPSNFTTSCTVFLETEIISRIAEGEEVADIISGIYKTISDKIGNMNSGLNLVEDCVFTGGGAKDINLKDVLEKKMGVKLYIPKEPLTTCAFGAALLAQKNIMEVKCT